MEKIVKKGERTISPWQRTAPPPSLPREKEDKPKALVVSWNDLKLSAHGSVCVLAAGSWSLEWACNCVVCTSTTRHLWVSLDNDKLVKDDLPAPLFNSLCKKAIRTLWELGGGGVDRRGNAGGGHQEIKVSSASTLALHYLSVFLPPLCPLLSIYHIKYTTSRTVCRCHRYDLVGYFYLLVAKPNDC